MRLNLKLVIPLDISKQHVEFLLRLSAIRLKEVNFGRKEQFNRKTKKTFSEKVQGI